ncbi:dephospho-CoA kinase [Paraglaciecola arctica]|uniref:dephospho-CoA kinase n=1 Tax=Paraglaciecola arctica TaxID=1128911 RepID=UPI001C075364|nr:dephospho-CoA kinase [Paraglaciecola arctica]MBU3004087.1 dephospho-CoA kinase [Paraglaciecola arctica]
MSDYVVGISGGIGSGKTTVTDLFAKLGVDIIDADVIAREVVEPGTPALKAIVAKFGVSVLDESGKLNRAKLRTLVFADIEIKNWLNQLLHPAIRELMMMQIQQAKSKYCLLSVPLLVENKSYEWVDRVAIVDVDEQTQLQRTVLRDKTNEQQIRAIMSAQATRQQRLAVAEDVIDNTGNREDLIETVSQLHQQYLKLANQKNGELNTD